MSKKTDRNIEIARRYAEGASMRDLREEFRLSRGRIYQILKEAGAETSRRGKPSDRDLFLGINVSEPVKNALRAEAARRGVSVSSLSSEALREMLVACGYPLEAEKIA